MSPSPDPNLYRILDAAAFALCQENKLSMLVFGMEGEGNITRALLGERIGTLVTAERAEPTEPPTTSDTKEQPTR